MNRSEELRRKVNRYIKSGKEDIELYWDDDIGNIQRFKGRITFWKQQAELKGIKETKEKMKREIEELLDQIPYKDYIDEAGSWVISQKELKQELKQKLKEL